MIPAAPWTLTELSDEVQRRLTALGLLSAQADGRVAAAPDARTARYYGTLGLLDRPRLINREARYENRHVLQLVAIKALQAKGLPLAQIQKALYGRSDAELEGILGSAAGARRAARPAAVRWQELTIEPGVRLMVEEGWSRLGAPAALAERIGAALAALEPGEE